ncbi:outer membrane beta-barrel protein [Marinibactrum halimedae]|uniref:Outer membrane protein OmpA-like transmembrane domain-containing protein n=1 Tax=Marinibactrum halimedae TaxID=1444977 RepID=A0AA37T489_9GAMM|nr:outer membrane beta-barrel protein [Marinibactrum halimedae]MCD9460992.1 outer membrane beta-barrel protein [Marinibactrum halimedae]GLS24778.1 hypothetical protein GCM10007877_04920 [Marinibactrum halimedae]
MFKKGVLASSLLILSSVVSAEGFYTGISVGESSVDVSGFDDETTYGIVGGYKFFEHFALELSYIDLGTYEFNEVLEQGIVEFENKIDVLDFSAVGILPLSDSFELFAEAGVFYWEVEADARFQSIDGNDFSITANEDGFDLSLGLGATAHFGENFSMTLKYQSFDADDEISNLSLGALIHF